MKIAVNTYGKGRPDRTANAPNSLRPNWGEDRMKFDDDQGPVNAIDQAKDYLETN